MFVGTLSNIGKVLYYFGQLISAHLRNTHHTFGGEHPDVISIVGNEINMQHLVMTTLIGFECNIFSVCVATIRMLNKKGNTVCQKYLTDITYLKRCRNGFKFKKN